jgi:excisionase family DNA binding protein
MPRIAGAILALLYAGMLLLCGDHPQVGGDHALAALVFAGMTAAAEPDLITASIQEFIRISGLGNTTIYRLLNEGELESVSVGRRRLILIDSYRRYLERSRGTPGQKPLARPPLPTRDRRAARSARAR